MIIILSYLINNRNRSPLSSTLSRQHSFYLIAFLIKNKTYVNMLQSHSSSFYIGNDLPMAFIEVMYKNYYYDRVISCERNKSLIEALSSYSFVLNNNKIDRPLDI